MAGTLDWGWGPLAAQALENGVTSQPGEGGPWGTGPICPEKSGHTQKGALRSGVFMDQVSQITEGPMRLHHPPQAHQGHTYPCLKE